MADTPATPFRAALDRAKEQRETARRIGEELRADQPPPPEPETPAGGSS